MIGEARTIARIVELIHIPIQHAPEPLRDIYREVSGSCGYDNFLRQQEGARLEAATEGGAVSRVSFQRDRITFHEELGNVTLDQFRQRIDEVVTVAGERLGIPLFILRTVTQRVVIASPGGRHATQFLGENVFRLGAVELGSFGRAVHLVGLRLNLPSSDPKVGSHQVRLEAYLRDPRSLFVEDLATFKLPVPARDKERLAVELREVEEIVNERVGAFLSQFPKG